MAVRARVFVHVSLHGEREVANSRQVYAVARHQLVGNLVFQSNDSSNNIRARKCGRLLYIPSYTLQSHHLVLYGYRPVFSLFRRLAVILYKFVIYTHISFYLIYSCFLFCLDTYKIIFRYLQNHNYIRIPLIYLSFEKYLSKLR